MAYTILITKRAKKDIETLDVVVRKHLGKRLLHVAGMSDLRTQAKHLENPSIGTYRIRVGDYRVLFDIDGKTMVILRVQHRKDVYRRL